MQPGARLLLAGLLALWVQLIPRSAQEHLDTCWLPSDPGPCDGYFPRYFYNSASKKCEKFIYGGCGGNKNNFKTLKECERTCV
ncbi:Kunitz-type serine protease inhibitor 1, partial [Varanus komodoensis]